MNNATINYGILGCGNIAKRVAQGINYAKDSNLYAFASRDITKAKEYSKKYNATKYYGNYDELLTNDKIDVIYICVPNKYHYDLIVKCLNHHKNVVCEKPMVRTISELDEVYSLAKQNKCLLMEAHKACFIPLNKLLKQRIEANEFGKLKEVEAEYSFEVLSTYNDKRDHWVFDEEFGGASYDIGVYPLSFINYIVGSKIKDFKTETLRHSEFVADFGFNASIEYENGVIGKAYSSWYKTPKDKGQAILTFDKCKIIIPAYWKASKATIIRGDKVENVEVPLLSDFTGEVEEVTWCLNNGLLESPIMNYESSLEILKILEDVNQYRMIK